MATLTAMVNSVNSTEVIVAIICFIFLLHSLRSNGQPWNWPLIGMLPLFSPINRLYDNITRVFECTKGTFEFRGPWFCNRDMIFTCSPANFHHTLSPNFSNYPKGSDAQLLFEEYGRFLFALDFDEWRNHRKITHRYINGQAMPITPKINKEIFEKGLIPVLDHACEQGIVMDLHDILRRFMLDVTVLMVAGYNPGSLCIEFTEDPVLKAMEDINQGILVRHMLPEFFWKLKSWLDIGQEKKMLEASKIIDDFVSKCMQKMKDNGISLDHFLSSSEETTNFIKGILFASTDTASSALAWFFWLLQKNPLIQNKIREEIAVKLPINKLEKILFFHPEELNNLVFLHAALLESLRLYPSVPFQCRTCIQADILPSGHHVRSGTKVILSPYANGRMKSIWGEDCCEFKPERWISNNKLVPVPSNKFAAFSSGPRICPGKEIALIRLKAVAATIIHNYDIQLMKNHPVIPETAIILHMKYGLKAKITKRST